MACVLLHGQVSSSLLPVTSPTLVRSLQYQALPHLRDCVLALLFVLPPPDDFQAWLLFILQISVHVPKNCPSGRVYLPTPSRGHLAPVVLSHALFIEIHVRVSYLSHLLIVALHCSLNSPGQASFLSCNLQIRFNCNQLRLTKREELSFLTVLAFPKASSSGLALMI